jgi:hypothetical protein
MSTYEPGKGWSQATRIFKATGIQWDNQTASRIDAFGSDRLVVSFVILDANGMSPVAIAVLRGSGTAWEPLIPALTETPMSANIVSSGHQTLLAYIGSNFQHKQLNSAFVVHSEDGNTWSRSQLLSDVRLGPVSELTLIRSKAGVYHVLWIQGEFLGDAVLNHRYSSDGGKTWSASDTTRPPRGFHSLRATTDDCGVVHVAYDDWGGGGTNGHLDYVQWQRGWSEPQHLFPELRSAGSDISVSPDGRLVLAFLAQASNQPLTSRNTTRIAFMSSGRR